MRNSGSFNSVTDVSALISGSQWSASGNTTVITYSFSGGASRYGAEAAGFSATRADFSAQDQAATREVLAAIHAVCNVSFVEVQDDGTQCGQIRYAYSAMPNQMGYTGFAFYPSEAAAGGDVWIGTAQADPEWVYLRAGLVLHETLHALGLKHPFEGPQTLDDSQNVIANTVMSYSPIPGSDSGALSNHPRSPMPMDVLALQQLYGQAAHNEGDTTYDLASTGLRDGYQVIWDSAGVDTLDASRAGNGVALDLHAGGRSDIGAYVQAFGYGGGRQSGPVTDTLTLAIAESCSIENAVGSAFADALLGNDGANVLAGGAGDDVLAGAGGNDRIDGGAGTDTAEFAGILANFRIERQGDTFHVTDRAGTQGTDVLTGVEKLRFQDLSVDLTVQDAAAAVSSARVQAVVELYVGFFNRMPDAQGFGFWLEQMNAGMSTRTVAENFYSAAQTHSRLTGYAPEMSNADFVRVIYKNVLGRSSVDSEGLAYWCDALGSGCESRGSLLEAILQSAHSFGGDAQFGDVAQLLANKFTVGKTLAVDMGLTWNSAEESISKGMQIAAAVTSVDVSAALSLIGIAPQDLALG